MVIHPFKFSAGFIPASPASRLLLHLAAALLFTVSGHAQPFQARIEGTPADHTVFWPTQLNYNYHVQTSTNLNEWLDTGIHVLGDGTEKDVGFTKTDARLFYRVEKTGFLVIPTPMQRVDLIDGVCFGFSLDFFTVLPAKLRLYSRLWNTGAAWTQIGSITELATIRGVKTVRGSVVWVPEVTGEYEVKAEAVNSSGVILASEQRHVIVGQNTPPTVTVTGVFGTPGSEGLSPNITTEVSDADGDEVRRVAYFDNGFLLGEDNTPPFDTPRDYEDRIYKLTRGPHQLTAKAYDSRGAVGNTAAPYTVTVSTGNARPVLAVTSPQDGLIIQQGTPLTIKYTVSDPDGDSDLRRVDAYENLSPVSRKAFDAAAPFTDLTLSTGGWELGIHTIKVFATDNSTLAGTPSYPIYFNVFIRSAGTTDTFAAALVANIVDATTAAPSNPVFKGVVASTTQFTTGTASGLQMNTGIVMTTGLASSWNAGDLPPQPGFPDLTERTSHLSYAAGDLSLQDRIAGTVTRDAAVLEFDVFCTNSQLEFDYQFGSDEYDEFIGRFNDGFMITIDGVIVSLLPDCSDIVAVNTLNNGYINDDNEVIHLPLNRHLFLDDDLDIDPTVLPVNQPKQVEYDGLTVRLRSHALVVPNKFHHIRIVIADVDDYEMDSALFLQKSSVRTINVNP
jgi:hypothetical protein